MSEIYFGPIKKHNLPLKLQGYQNSKFSKKNPTTQKFQKYAWSRRNFCTPQNHQESEIKY